MPRNPPNLPPGPEVDMNRPGNCYGGMFGHMLSLPIRGTSGTRATTTPSPTAPAAARRTRTLTLMIEAWRKGLGNPDLAFGIIAQDRPGAADPRQLPFGHHGHGCLIREAHYNTFAALHAGDKNIGFAASDDMRAWYHPQIKIPVGERIARWALATQYGVNMHSLASPDRQGDEGRWQQAHPHARHGGRPYSGPILGFALAGARQEVLSRERITSWMRRRTHRSVIVLTSRTKLPPEPVAYRYGWHRNPMGNLKISSSELPLPISRSERNWSMNDLHEAYTGKRTAADSGSTARNARRWNRALQTADKAAPVQGSEAYVREHQADKGN